MKGADLMENVDIVINSGILIEQLVTTRKKAGLTQVDMARKLGLAQTQVARIENNKNKTSLETVMKYLSALGFTLEIVPIEDKEQAKANRINRMDHYYSMILQGLEGIKKGVQEMDMMYEKNGTRVVIEENKRDPEAKKETLKKIAEKLKKDDEK